MKLSKSAADAGVDVVRCEGPITLIEPTPANPFEILLGPEAFSRRVLLNLQRSSVIDSSGVGWLIRSHQSFQKDGGKLVLYEIPPLVAQVLQLMKMQKLLHLAADEAAARALLESIP